MSLGGGVGVGYIFLLYFHLHVVRLCNMKIYPVNPIFWFDFLDPTKYFYDSW